MPDTRDPAATVRAATRLRRALAAAAWVTMLAVAPRLGTAGIASGAEASERANPGLLARAPDRQSASSAALLRLGSQLAPTRFAAPLTLASRQWLASHRMLTVGVWGNDYAPVQFRPGNNAMAGIAADYLHLLANSLDTPIRVRWFASQAAALAALKSHDIDLLSVIGSPGARAFDDVERVPYLRMPLAIVRRAGPALDTDGAWHGRAAVVEDQRDALAVLRRHQPAAAPPLDEPSLYRALAAVSLGEADYYIGDLVSATFCVEQGMYLNLRVARVDSAQTAFSVAVASDRPALKDAVETSFGALPAWLEASVLRRWAAGAAQDMQDGPLPLSPAERAWIAAHPVVPVGVDTADAPYTFVDSAGEFSGVHAELLKLIGRRTGLRFKVVARDTLPALEADLRAGHTALVTTLMPTPARNAFMAFSDPVMPLIWAIVAREGDASITSLRSLDGKRLALVTGHALASVVLAVHPSIRLVFVRTAADALDLVARGGADATLQTMGGASYSIERFFPNRLRIAGTAFDDPDQVRFGVSPAAPELLGILDKALAAITPAERAAIASRWLAHINYPSSTWDSLRRSVFRWLPWGLAALALAVVWNSLLQYQIRRRRQVERELRAARDAAERASADKSEFLALMSHEIRTPMSAVLGLLEQAQRRAAAGIADPAPLAIARRSALGLLELVGDLLDVHKSEAGELRVTPRAIDLRALLAETATLFAAVAHEKGIELHAGTAPDVPHGARFDPLRLRQVIGNVLSNAVKFTERGEVVLHASLEVDPDGKPILCVDIRDTGEGIAPDELDRLFEPFRQTSAAAVRGGTGLGLVVVKRLVTLMNGSVDVTSAAGRGTCVLLRLPCIACDPPAAASGDGFESGSSGAPARLRAGASLRVLAVDDHPLNLRILADQLRELGCTPVEACDADAALATLDSGVDLMFTDCNMPGMSGLELTRLIRAAENGAVRPRLPILGYTANALPEAHADCLAAGMDQVLVKPLALGQLAAALARWLPARFVMSEAREPPACEAAPQPVTPELAASLAEDLAALKASIDRGAWQTAADYAHRMRGVIACASPDEAVDHACIVLEMQACRRAPDIATALNAQYARLEALLQRHVAVVNAGRL